MKISTVQNKDSTYYHENKPRLLAEMEFPINETSINAIIKPEMLSFIRDNDNERVRRSNTVLAITFCKK